MAAGFVIGVGISGEKVVYGVGVCVVFGFSWLLGLFRGGESV